MRKLLIATNNPGKIKEYREIFKQLRMPLELVSLEDLGIKRRKKENGKTFRENAVQKAKFYSKLSNLPTLSDDGGLEIDYLDGRPGIKSRRWPGHRASDRELINFTIKELKGVSNSKRGAQLRIIIALAIPKKRIYTSEGVLRGFILERPIKKVISGYPFRSLFYISELSRVYGQLSFQKEVEIGHRKKAVQKLIPTIKNIFKA